MKTNHLTLASLAITSTLAQPCLSSDFSLAARLGVGADNAAVWLSLNAVPSTSNGTLLLIAEKLARYPGSPVSLKGPSGNASLTVQIDKANSACDTIPRGHYGISVPDLGELYGDADPVIATKGQKWPHFFYGQNGEIEPQMTAASQLWFLCDQYINGTKALALSWGIFASNGSAPTGCSPTSVKQVFNIPCAGA